MKLALIFGSLLATGFSLNAFAANAPASAETIDVQVVDYSGKPPFKRQVVTMAVDDVAQLESMGQEAVEYVEVKEVIKRGKPPYRRTTTMMPVYDVAQFEVLEEDEKPSGKRHYRPPFNRH